jgi:hypothetical protein
MKKLALLSLLLLAACKRTKPTPTAVPSAGGKPIVVSRPNDWPVNVAGEPYQLRLKVNSLTFCDDRGGQRLDLVTGIQTSFVQPCVTNKADDSDPTPNPDDNLVEVASPDMEHEANDRVCIDSCYWLNGRARNWLNEGKTVIIGTGSEVEMIDGEKDRTVIVSHEGADKLAIGSGWVAWIPYAQSSVHLLRESSIVWISEKRSD